MWTCRSLSDCSNKNSIVLEEELHLAEVDLPHLRAVVVHLVATEEEEALLLEEEVIHTPTRRCLQIVVSQGNLLLASLQVITPNFSSQVRIFRCQPAKCKTSESSNSMLFLTN